MRCSDIYYRLTIFCLHKISFTYTPGWLSVIGRNKLNFLVGFVSAGYATNSIADCTECGKDNIFVIDKISILTDQLDFSMICKCVKVRIMSHKCQKVSKIKKCVSIPTQCVQIIKCLPIKSSLNLEH